jgi:hypothetical protein
VVTRSFAECSPNDAGVLQGPPMPLNGTIPGGTVVQQWAVSSDSFTLTKQTAVKVECNFGSTVHAVIAPVGRSEPQTYYDFCVLHLPPSRGVTLAEWDDYTEQVTLGPLVQWRVGVLAPSGPLVTVLSRQRPSSQTPRQWRRRRKIPVTTGLRPHFKG